MWELKDLLELEMLSDRHLFLEIIECLEACFPRQNLGYLWALQEMLKQVGWQERSTL